MQLVKRAIHLDFHTMPGIYDFGKDWNAKEFAARLKASHVATINAFAQCNLGFCYYPTEIGVPYSQMKFDLFGEMVEACHAAGIRVVAYVSAGLNHEQSRRHPEWCQIDKDGYIIKGDRTENFFRTVCYNTGYKEHVYALVKEILKYNPDGFFFDSVVERPCYCSVCSEKMAALGIDINDDKAVSDFGSKSTLEFARGLKEIIPEGKTMRLNGLCVGDEFSTHSEVECLPSAVWGYDFFYTTIAYSRNVFNDALYMTGRFQTDWGDFGGIKSKTSLENDFYDSLCNGVQFAVGDHMHPRCKLRDEVYDMIGDIFAQMKEYEKWTDEAKYTHEIGVLYDKRDLSESFSHKGIVRMLGELKYNCDILDEDMDYQLYSLLILPDDLKISEKMEKKINSFVNSGKPVISTGTAGILDEEKGIWLKEWGNLFEYLGKDTTKTSYYRYKDSDFDYASYSDGVLIKPKKEAEIVCDYVTPYFDRHWDGMHGYAYTPSDKPNGCSAVIIKDNLCHISFKICQTYYSHAPVFHKELLSSILSRMLPERLIVPMGIPSSARVTLTNTDEYKLLHVKVTHPEPRGLSNIVEDHSFLPAGRSVMVKGKYKNVLTLPEKEKIDYHYSNGYTKVVLPEITGYKMFMLIDAE